MTELHVTFEAVAVIDKITLCAVAFHLLHTQMTQGEHYAAVSTSGVLNFAAILRLPIN